MAFKFRNRIRLLKLDARAVKVFALAVSLAWMYTGWLSGAFAQDAAVSAPTQELKVETSFTDKASVTPDEAITVRLSRPVQTSEGRISILLGSTDLTSLFVATETELSYNSKVLPLPQGETEMTLYLVSPTNDWKEIARFTLRVQNAAPASQEQADNKTPDRAAEKPAQAETTAQPQPAPQTGSQKSEAAQTEKPPRKRFGFEKLDLIPSVNINIKSQPAQSTFPFTGQPARPTFTDLNTQFSLKSDIARGGFTSQTQFDFVGSSFQQEALRFGQLGNDAPQIDLASYLMQFQAGKLKYQVGTFSFGALRHLINGFSSRGVTLSMPITPRFDFALTAMNGTSIVGFSNFFGLDKQRHRLLSGTLGMEFLPKRPGGLRVEAGVLDGWLQPLSGFNQANVNDAERSQGIGFRLLASDPSQRFKLETGFSRSRFTSPSDSLLNQNSTVVALPTVTRNAYYLETGFDILKDFSITKTKKANLSLAFRHETVDPLFRSLGASTQADKSQNEVQVQAAIGEITAQYLHTRFNDNLANIPSILRSLTRANTLAVAVPLASLFSDPAKPSPWLPRMSYTFNRIHQFGAAIPVNGGFEFEVNAIPNLVGTNQALSADWQIQKWRVGYRLNHSFQNNRQIGSQLADQTNLTNGFSVGISPLPTIDLNLDINAESAGNKEARTIDRTFRIAPGINWRMTPKATFASNFSSTFAGDAADTRGNRSVEFDMQWSYQFAVERDRFRKLQSQFFIRYANRYSRATNSLLIQNDLTKNQILNLGISFTFF